MTDVGQEGPQRISLGWVFLGIVIAAVGMVGLWYGHNMYVDSKVPVPWFDGSMLMIDRTGVVLISSGVILAGVWTAAFPGKLRIFG